MQAKEKEIRDNCVQITDANLLKEMKAAQLKVEDLSVLPCLKESDISVTLKKPIQWQKFRIGVEAKLGHGPALNSSSLAISDTSFASSICYYRQDATNDLWYLRGTLEPNTN